jgi:energy-converting hydrogenase Eha subunit E
MKLYKTILIIQGIYTTITALWAIVDIGSFMKVTGPKNDIWLVKTLSVILLAIGLTFISHSFQHKISLPAITLALSTSLSLAIIDFHYVSEGVISRVYAADGIIQVIFFVFWIYIAAARKQNG